MNYKLDLENGVRPLVKGDLQDLRLEVLTGEECIHTDYKIWFDEDENYRVTNINTIKSKLLKAMFPND